MNRFYANTMPHYTRDLSILGFGCLPGVRKLIPQDTKGPLTIPILQARKLTQRYVFQGRISVSLSEMGNQWPRALALGNSSLASLNDPRGENQCPQAKRKRCASPQTGGAVYTA